MSNYKRVFTLQDEEFIRVNFGAMKRKEMAEKLGVTSGQLGNKIAAMGIYKNRSNPVTHFAENEKRIATGKLIFHGAITRHVSY